jgi:sortase (surface protein transpeptidase)
LSDLRQEVTDRMIFPARSRRFRAHWSTRTYYEEGRRRRWWWWWWWSPLIVLGTGLIIGGALVAAGSLVGSGRLAGGAVEIPAAVGTSAPLPATAPTAVPLARSAPVRIEIPALRVSAPVMRLGVAANGSVQVPPLGRHNLAGWYDPSVTPGQRGSPVILGHVDSFTGVSVFFSIKTLHPGNTIDVVRANGSTAVFTVDGVQKVVKSGFPGPEVYGNVSFPSLRLVTCGGPFDTTTRQYLDNIVVYAHLIKSSS